MSNASSTNDRSTAALSEATGENPPEAMTFDNDDTLGESPDKDAPPQPPRQKRTRVLLSCRPCRTSKLKCDRQEPCSQCVKKDRQDLCQYAPKPEKRARMPKSMSARLHHLEGVVRSMMDADPDALQQSGHASQIAQALGMKPESKNAPRLQGQVVRGQNSGTSYVGETHCMAMLEDIEDLRAYFDDSDDGDEEVSPFNESDSPDLLIPERPGTMTRDELIAQLPERSVTDRLITRYFECMSPSQHTIHRPSFARMYARFRQDPNSVTLHWISQVFMMLALGIYYSFYQAPTEIVADSPVPPLDRIKHYRACAGWGLLLGKYMQPNPTTLPAFILYFESHFLFNRAAQMTSYVLSGVGMRLMMKMGLHRDPSKLAGISAFEGEMRRRQWNMMAQLETLVSFHVGLPGTTPLIDSDTELPRNLNDDDFDEDTVELPPARPMTDWTIVTYPIIKSSLMKIFSHISRQVHGLTPPTHADVMRLDGILQSEWRRIPDLMKVRPMEECVGSSPALLIQRFGIAALYNKSRCVLHRRYLAEAVPRREHDYSRQQCLEAAIILLRNQSTIWHSSRPGRSLASHGWFVSSLSVHDYLLAAMVLYIAVQSEHYGNPASDCRWMSDPDATPPTKEELKGLIRTSWEIWSVVAQNTTEVRRTADTLALMLARLGSPVGHTNSLKMQSPADAKLASLSDESAATSVSMEKPSMGALGSLSDPLAPGMNFEAAASSSTGGTPYSFPPATEPLGTQPLAADTMTSETLPAMDFPTSTAGSNGMTGMFDFDPTWISQDATMDWRNLDISFAHSHTAGGSVDDQAASMWAERVPMGNAGPPGQGFMGSWMDGAV